MTTKNRSTAVFGEGGQPPSAMTCEQLEDEIRRGFKASAGLLRRALAQDAATGLLLIELKLRVRGEKRSWTEYVRETFRVSEDVAEEFIKLAKGWTDLEPLLEQHPGLTRTAALRLLSVLGGPRPTREEVKKFGSAVRKVRTKDQAVTALLSGVVKACGATDTSDLKLEIDEDDGGEVVPTDRDEVEASHVRMAQLFFNADTLPVFQDTIEWLGERLGTTNTTDTVFEAVKQLRSRIEREEREGGTGDPRGRNAATVANCFDRRHCHWEDLLDDLTPVERVGNLRFKREDKFAPLGYGGINGSKVRQAIWLIHRYVRTAPNPVGILSTSSFNSPQISAASVIGRHYGLDVVHVVGAAGPGTMKANSKYPDVEIGLAAGARFLYRPRGLARHTVLQARLEKLAETEEFRDYYRLPYNLGPEDDTDAASIEAFHRVGARQVENLPDDMERLVIPCGSGNSTVSVLYGIGRRHAQAHNRLKNLKEIVLFGIGPCKLGLLMARLDAIDRVTGLGVRPIFSDGAYVIKTVDLTDVYEYSRTVHTIYEGIHFHPRYEGKVMKELLSRHPRLVNPGTVFWIVGSAPSWGQMREAIPDAEMGWFEVEK